MKKNEVMDIIEIALKVNGMSARTAEETGDLPTVFADFSGHIAQLYIRAYRNGWEAGKDPDKEFYFRTDKPLLWKDYCVYDDYMEALYERTF